MSLYGDYIKERAGKSIIDEDYGFATYYFLSDGNCYLEDIYVKPEMRCRGLASQLADMVFHEAKLNKAEYIIGSFDPQGKNPAISLKAQLAWGLEPFAIKDQLLYLRKKVD